MGGVDICEIKWSFYEAFWRSSSPNTVPVKKRTPDHIRKIPGHDKVLFIIVVEPYMLEKHLGKNKHTQTKPKPDVEEFQEQSELMISDADQMGTA